MVCHFYRSIIGFINKVTAQEYLMAKNQGTFLLRFSDGELGGVSIAWVTITELGNVIYNYVIFTLVHVYSNQIYMCDAYTWLIVVYPV